MSVARRQTAEWEMPESAQSAVERVMRAGTCEAEAAACPGVLALVIGVGARVRSSAAAAAARSVKCVRILVSARRLPAQSTFA